MLDLDETDLWPQARTTHSLPIEVRAVYPHRDSVPIEVWLDLFRSAQQEIDILDTSSLFLATDTEILATLTNRARVGVQERICLADPDWPEASDVPDHTRKAFARHQGLLQADRAQIRLQRTPLNNALFRADDELLVSQQAFAIPASRTPVLRLRRTDNSDMMETYRKSFDRIWTRSQPLG
jgi:hypothetical protein